MSLGVAFALTAEQSQQLLAMADDEHRDEWLQDHEEEVEGADWFQYDKTWDELVVIDHRVHGEVLLGPLLPGSRRLASGSSQGAPRGTRWPPSRRKGVHG